MITFLKNIFNQNKPRLLLHVCCAPCSVFMAQELNQTYAVTLYYYNPNINSAEEYDRRLVEVQKMAKHYKLPLIAEPYNHGHWQELVRGHESAPERGSRCRICYRERLHRTFEFAVKHGFSVVATSLITSPHKDCPTIMAIGQEMAENMSLKFLANDWPKDLYQKSNELTKQFNFYRQNYCGCELSIRLKTEE